MKVADLEKLGACLEAEFASVEAMSVALSGSMSRGDFRVSTAGTIASDVDLIPVVARAGDIETARAQLAPRLARIANQFHVACTAAITLVENFLLVPHAAYVTSMTARPFVCDPLGLRNQLSFSLVRSPQQVMPWRVQPITYYLAKAGSCGREKNVRKAERAMRLLATDPVLSEETVEGAWSNEAAKLALLDGQHDQMSLHRACVTVLSRLVEIHEIELLPSSLEFLKRDAAGDLGEATFHSVRDLVFLENQGLSFEQSAMVAHPS